MADIFFMISIKKRKKVFEKEATVFKDSSAAQYDHIKNP